jgi:pimeloyl-ACP methyl ester carboxylesterase
MLNATITSRGITMIRRHRKSAIWLLGFAAALAQAADSPPRPAPVPAPLVPPVVSPSGDYLSVEALRAKYGDRAGRIMEIGGVEVYYKDEGKGPAILMVHGSQSTLKTWDGVAPRLIERGYRVIRYDIPPQGLSGPVSVAAAARLQPVDIAEGLLARLGVDRVTYAGVSSGGTLGVFLAAKRPDLVERLVLSNSPADTVSNSHQVYPPSFAEAQRQAREAGGFRSQFFWDQFLDYYAGDPSRFDRDIREQYYDINRRQPEPNFYALTAVVADQPRAKAAMAAVRAPTLLVWGARDALLLPAAADALASYLTGTQVSTLMLPDVGHYPPLEVPARFADIVANYIEAVTPRR